MPTEREAKKRMSPHASDFMEKGANSHDVIRVSNPTAEDITVEWERIPHILKAGETQMFTRFIGEHICKHLTDREIGANSPNFWNPSLRRKWRDKIIVGVVTKHASARKLTPGEQAAAEQEAMRKQQEERIQTLEQQINQATASQQADPAAVKEAQGETATDSSTTPAPNTQPDLSNIEIEIEEEEKPAQKLTWPQFSKAHAEKGTSREETSRLWAEYKKANEPK